MFIGRTIAQAEAPILGPPDVKSRPTGKDSDAGKIESKRKREWLRMRWLDSMVDLMDMKLSKLVWRTEGTGQMAEDRGQRSLASYSPWSRKEWDMTFCFFIMFQFGSFTQSCPTLCDPTDCSTSGFPVQHHLPELAQTHVHQVSDAIHPSHSLLSSSPAASNLSQHQGLFQ